MSIFDFVKLFIFLVVKKILLLDKLRLIASNRSRLTLIRLFFGLFVMMTTNSGYGQTTIKDSVNVLYKNYFELFKVKDDVDHISNTLRALEDNYAKFNDIIISNNEEIKKLTKKELFSLQVQLRKRRDKIITTADFVNAANVSLNAIRLLDDASAYFNEITALNNPENTDLGFSLSQQIEIILKQKIIKGKNKINGSKSNKFLQFASNIIKSPITETISSAIPIVASIKSVISLVMGTAVKGDDISLDDIEGLKKSLKSYTEHYAGLARAQNDFYQNLVSLDIRKKGLVLILTQYTRERISTLSPEDLLKADKNLSLTQLINAYYEKGSIQQKVDLIISKAPSDYNRHLNDNRLIYPIYALNQAKFIRDEIESLGKEYISIYNSYQNTLEEVLKNSKNIGDHDKIDAKIKSLKEKTANIEKTFNESLNIEKLNKKFKALMQY